MLQFIIQHISAPHICTSFVDFLSDSDSTLHSTYSSSNPSTVAEGYSYRVSRAKSLSVYIAIISKGSEKVMCLIKPKRYPPHFLSLEPILQINQIDMTLFRTQINSQPEA